MYNDELKYVAEREAAGDALVIRPEGPIPIGHVCHNPEQMQRAYDMGRTTGEKWIDRIIEFWKK